MKTNKRILLLGVLLGLITVFFLSRYINSLRASEEVSASSEVEVVVATNNIPEHVRITEEMVTIASVPEEAVHPDAVKSLESVVGGISRSEIVNGEQVLSGRVATEDMKATLSYKIPETMRAVTIPVDEITGVANHIAVGDKVDILVSYSIEDTTEEEEEDADPTVTYTQLQNVEVLAVGKYRTPPADGETETAQESSNITILVNPEQAEVIAFANVKGQFHLSLRNPADEEINELDSYNIRNFGTYRER